MASLIWRGLGSGGGAASGGPQTASRPRGPEKHGAAPFVLMKTTVGLSVCGGSES